ncbi:MAG: TlyA family RNA methyltransferase [Nitrospiraceae bacterium]|nr:MAG: TlyA family RNA methyltransferase [Nitrospiraceae bacterium]
MATSLKKERLDRVLFDKGLVDSREKAKALILEGGVSVNGTVVDKAGTQVRPDDVISLARKMPYVSRGGLKLEHALKEFEIVVKNKVAMDVGASTGGFTDCLLQNGAAKVYAIDVGYGQIDLKLRNDDRVSVIEKTNIRYMKREIIHNDIDIATIDVSFISLLKVIPRIMEFLTPEGEIVALIKPQFEAGRKDVGKGGVVKDERVHRTVIEKIKTASEGMGMEVLGTTPSPVKGPKGNIEFLIYMRKPR